MRFDKSAVELGTDSGPSCDVCQGTIWIYRLWPTVNSYAAASCCSCHARAEISWPTTSQAPATIDDMKALHASDRRRGFATAVRQTR